MAKKKVSKTFSGTFELGGQKYPSELTGNTIKFQLPSHEFRGRIGVFVNGSERISVSIISPMDSAGLKFSVILGNLA